MVIMTRLDLPNFVLLAAMLLSLPSTTNAQGIVLPGSGPVNRSMAGAAVAAPIDAAGAIHWNPASLSGLEQSEFLIGVEMLELQNHLTSSVAGTQIASTRSDSGVSPLPAVAVAFRPSDSRWSYGLGLFAVGGFGVNYPGDPSNPILSPPFPGAVYSKLSVIQLVPTVAWQATDRLSIGFAPTVTMVEANLDPDLLATPGPFGYPAATHSRTHWGLGFQAGLYYETDCQWRWGVSYKSPQWVEELTFFDSDPTGLSQTLRLNVDYPGIVSVGAAYYGIPRTVWAIDVRYVDYDNTELFGHATGFDNTGAVTGLGWRSVFSVASGLQYQLSEALSLRLGYVYSQNPIRDRDAFFNVASPAIYEHIAAIGATVRVTCRTSLSIAYLRAFENSIEGVVPLAPELSVGTTQTINALVAGLQVRF
jgi:long-chain fatty acid transport protein